MYPDLGSRVSQSHFNTVNLSYLLGWPTKSFDCIFPDSRNQLILFVGLVPYQILFSSIDRHKLLIIFQFSCCSKVSQLINRLAVLPNLPHDVAWLNVPVHHSVFSQVVHPLHWREEGEKYFSSDLRNNWGNNKIYTHLHTAKLWGTLSQAGQRRFLAPPVGWADFLLNNTPSPAPSV